MTHLGESTKKYITSTTSIEKVVTKTDKNGKKITKYTWYILQFTDSAIIMASSLSSPVKSVIFLKENHS